MLEGMVHGKETVQLLALHQEDRHLQPGSCLKQ